MTIYKGEHVIAHTERYCMTDDAGRGFRVHDMRTNICLEFTRSVTKAWNTYERLTK